MTWVTTVKLCKDFWKKPVQDTLDIAAALAFLAGGKKPLFYDSMPVTRIEAIGAGKIVGIVETGVKGKNSPLGDNDRSERKSFRDDHLQSYRLEVGEYHGAQKGDIVWSDCHRSRSRSPAHGENPHVSGDHAFNRTLPADMPPRKIFEALKSVWVQGHQMNISIDKGRPRPGGKGGNSGKALDKGGKKFSKGKDFKKKSKPRFRS